MVIVGVMEYHGLTPVRISPSFPPLHKAIETIPSVPNRALINVDHSGQEAFYFVLEGR